MIQRRRPSLAELWAQTSGAGPHRAGDARASNIEPAALDQGAGRNVLGNHIVDMDWAEDRADDAMLVILRGNSGVGKSALATALRRGEPSMALVEEQFLQRLLLPNTDAGGGDALVDLIDLTVRFLLDHGRSVVLDGLLRANSFRPTIQGFLLDYRGRVHLYYLDAALDSPLRRGPDQQLHRRSGAELPRQRQVPCDLLAIPDEVLIPEHWTLEATLAGISADLVEARAASPRYG